MKRDIMHEVLFFFFCACFLIGTGSLSAQGYRNPPEGNAAISQAGAFTAQCDDASAVTHNPAGLVQISGQQVILGSSFLYPVTEYRNNGTRKHAVSDMNFLPFLYYAADMGNERLGFGLGVTFPYGQSTEWSKNTVRQWGFNNMTASYNVPNKASMQTLNVTPALAYSFTPEFSAGIGLNIYRSSLEADYISMPLPMPVEMPARLRVDGTGYGGSLGMLYRRENFSAGFKYISGFKVDYDGSYRIGELGIREDASLEMEFPPVAGIGLAVYPDSSLKIELGAEWIGYSAFKEMPVSIGVLSMPVPRNWKDCYTFSLGTQYRKSERTTLRGGVAYTTNPVPDSTWEPSLPAADSFLIIAGGEFSGSLGVFSLSLGTNLFTERTMKGGEAYEGKYRSTGYFGTVGFKKPF